MSFAKVDRPVEGVPVEAFELLDDNLTVELWAACLFPCSSSFDAGMLVDRGHYYNQDYV